MYTFFFSNSGMNEDHQYYNHIEYVLLSNESIGGAEVVANGFGVTFLICGYKQDLCGS